MRDLVIVGAGGHGREVLECVLAINSLASRWNFLGFVDDHDGAEAVAKWPVLGKVEWLNGRDCDVVVAIGAPAVRARVVRRLNALGATSFPCVVHPSAQLGTTVVLGEGVMIGANAVLTANIVLGRHALVNTAAVVSHDCVLGDFVTLAPAVCLCGAVQLQEGAELGASCTVTPAVTVGAWAIVGAGSTVIKSVERDETVVGVPARSISKRSYGWQEK